MGWHIGTQLKSTYLCASESFVWTWKYATNMDVFLAKSWEVYEHESIYGVGLTCLYICWFCEVDCVLVALICLKLCVPVGCSGTLDRIWLHWGSITSKVPWCEGKSAVYQVPFGSATQFFLPGQHLLKCQIYFFHRYWHETNWHILKCFAK